MSQKNQCPCNICPPIMEDRRIFTSYLPNQTVNEHIRSVNKIPHSTLFRLHLQHNADCIQNVEFGRSECAVKCHHLDDRDPYYYEDFYKGKRKHYLRDLNSANAIANCN